MDVILYSIYVKEKPNFLILAQLYYSIKTLRKYNTEIPIVIVINSGINLENYNINGMFNIVRDFDNIQILQIEFSAKHLAIQKWRAVETIFNKTNYNKVLYLDNDTFFSRNPKDFFTDFSEDYFYFRPEWGDACYNIYGFYGMNSGQFFLSRKVFQQIPVNFIELIEKEIVRSYRLVLKANKLSYKINEVIRENKKLIKSEPINFISIKEWRWSAEQFCSHKVLLDHGIQFELFPEGLFAVGATTVVVDHSKNPCEVITPIVHYFGGFSYLWFPSDLAVENFSWGSKLINDNSSNMFLELPKNLHCNKCYQRIFGLKDYEKNNDKRIKELYQQLRQNGSV